MGESSEPGPSGKVERLLEQEGLEEFGEYLVERWTETDDGDRLGLRPLAREFNVRLLETRLSSKNVGLIEGTAESYYDVLSDNDVSSGVRTQVRRTLEQAGIDVADLEDDFVSRQAIHTYLTKTRGLTPSGSDTTISTSSVDGTLNRLRERMRQVATSKIERLRDEGLLVIGDFRVLVDIQVYCEDCGAQQSVSDLIASGACNCE